MAVCFAPRCEPKQGTSDIAKTTQEKTPPTVAPSVKNDKSATNNHPGNEQPPNEDTASQWILVVAAVITAGFIGWQALETRHAARATADSVGAIKEQAGIMERQTKATETAANAAQKSAEIAEMALKLADRADVLLESAGLTHHPNSGSVLTGYSSALFRFKNFGRTRAVNVKFAVSLSVSETHSSPPPIEPVVLGADAHQTVRFPQFREWMTEKTFTGISKGEIPLTFQSRVTYEDIFGDSHIAENGGTYMPENDRFRLSGNRAD